MTFKGWNADIGKLEFQQTIQPSKVFYEASGREMTYTEAETACSSLDVLSIESAQDRVDFMMTNRLSGLYHLDAEKSLNSVSNRENFVDRGFDKSMAVCSIGKVDQHQELAL